MGRFSRRLRNRTVPSHLSRMPPILSVGTHSHVGDIRSPLLPVPP